MDKIAIGFTLDELEQVIESVAFSRVIRERQDASCICNIIYSDEFYNHRCTFTKFLAKRMLNDFGQFSDKD